MGPSLGPILKTNAQEEHGEIGLWLSKGRLENLCGMEEAAELVQELPVKQDPASGRPLYFYVEEKVEYKALWSRLAWTPYPNPPPKKGVFDKTKRETITRCGMKVAFVDLCLKTVSYHIVNSRSVLSYIVLECSYIYIEIFFTNGPNNVGDRSSVSGWWWLGNVLQP